MWKLKEEKLKLYKEAKKRGEIDLDIIQLLDLINDFECYVTLSSCSGRIAVLDLPRFGDKLAAKFLGKWHKGVSVEDVIAAAVAAKHIAWLILYPPILHVACKSIDAAAKLLRVANNAGFRRSGVISLKNLVVEISSLERLELPVAREGELLVGEDYFRLIVEIANEKLARGKDKLQRLYNLLTALKE